MAGTPQMIGSGGASPGIPPNSPIALFTYAPACRFELMNWLNPKRNSFTVVADSTRVLESIACWAVVSSLLPWLGKVLGVRPNSLLWLHRPNQLEFELSEKSPRILN